MILVVILIFSCYSSAEEKKVYIASITEMIDGGTYVYLNKVYDNALKYNSTVILEIDTPGGYIIHAKNIKNLIINSPVKTIAFVKGGALSAGALIALSAEELVMSPGSTIGAAEPRQGNQKADIKVLSMWSKELASAAQVNDRNEKIAKAMADSEIEIKGLVKKGELLTLTYKEAIDYKIADIVLKNRDEVLQNYDLQNNEIIEEKPGTLEGIVNWVTNPYISSFLLTIGIAGLIIEIFTIGFGVSGTLGVAALGLYFFGHILAGITGFEAVFLFLIGLILLAAEVFFIPGFGIAGIGGIIALIVSIVLTAPTFEQGIISLVVSIIGTIILLFISIKFLPTRKVWKRLILSDKQGKNNYVASNKSLNELVGQIGKTVTPLRPAGTAKINGVRVDVITSGEFIDSGKNIRIVKVEGVRVVAEEIEQENT
jgi:membrane-bound serine protease (ClpP class)